MPGEIADGAPSTRELRLALVLYGGVSLAIYMHGTTKELHRLVKASALLDRQAPASMTASERVYAALLTELAERDPHRVRTRVVVDVIAGTSAGGINGVYLAKAVARNHSQDALRDLWFKRGDIGRLLRWPERIPAWLKAPMLLALTVKTPPLKGDSIARWMYRALQNMDAGGREPDDLETLLPERHLLELFVTTTDFSGYQRDLLIADPKLVQDHTHRHVFTFRYGDGEDDFTPTDNGGLALAARSTMSFPGAFPPVSLRSIERTLATEGGNLAALRERLFPLYDLSHADPERSYFIDGGVLDNRPFDHAIAAIKRRPAGSEVDRRLLYLEPDPAKPDVPQPALPEKPPSPLATVLAAISGIPRKQPILDDILEVSHHNERVRRIRDIIEMTFAPIAAHVEQLVGTELGRLVQAPTAPEIGEWSARINGAAIESAGFAYATYIRSKVSGVVDRYAQATCRLCGYPDDCNQATFVRAVLHAWARTRLFTERDGRPAPADDQVEFLRTFDLDYGARRLQFVIDALSWWYERVGEAGYPTRAQLNEGKQALYELRDVLLQAMEGRGLDVDLTGETLAIFAREQIDDWLYRQDRGPEEYARERADALAQLEARLGHSLNATLDGFGTRLFERVHTLTAGWSVERRADLLVRYLGFPFFDTLLYPIQAVADTGERDVIDVVRMSPLDSTLLPPPDPKKPKLDGVRIMHFGAFFDRPGRENDYLWGRLDGAERLIGLLLGPNRTVDDHARWCRRAFGAIVEEERHELPHASALLEHVHRFVSA